MSDLEKQPKAIDRAGSGIRITWQDGEVMEYSGEQLRDLCPCALCKETPGHPAPQPRSPGPVSVKSAQAMGWYAIQLIFSDGHDSGIFPYELLRRHGAQGSAPKA